MAKSTRVYWPAYDALKIVQPLDVDAELAANLRGLTEEERAHLERSLLAEGCRDPIVVWQEGMVIADGHNRYEICGANGIPFAVEYLSRETKEEVLGWQRDNQFAKRNLTAQEVSYYRGKDYLATKRPQGAPPGNANAAKQRAQNEPFESDKTASSVGKKHGVGQATVKRDAEYAAAVDKIAAAFGEGFRTRALAGQSKLDKSDAIELANFLDGEPETAKHATELVLRGEHSAAKGAIKEAKKEKRRREREAERKAAEERMESITLDKRVQVVHADFRDALADIPEASVDLILTDPPYPAEYIPLYSEIGYMASACLRPGGALAAMVGQSYLPAIIERLSEHLAYHWTIAYMTPGGQAVQLWQRKVNTFWKPVLVFSKGEYDGEWLGDVARSDVNDNDKRFHHWGQSESGTKSLMERLSKPGDMVVDPFVGGGTTAVVAALTGRRFLGCDLDAKAIETTTYRLKEMAREAS